MQLHLITACGSASIYTTDSRHARCIIVLDNDRVLSTQVAESCLHVLFNRGVQIVRLTRSTVGSFMLFHCL